MLNQNKIENLLKELPLLRKIDLSLSRINRLNKDLKINLNKLQEKTITISGTNAKASTAAFLKAILEAANYKVDCFTSPHCFSYTERFIFESKEISEEDLFSLLLEVGKINASKPITIFEFLTSAFYFYSSSKSKSDFLIAEHGLLRRADAVTSIGHHLMNITCVCDLDHLEWLPEGKKNIDQIIYEKTSSINSKNIIISEQVDKQILNKIKSNIKNNTAKKFIFSDNYSYELNDEGFLYKGEHEKVQFPYPNLRGLHQVSNACTAIAAIKNLKKYNIKNEHIIKGLTSVNLKGRLEVVDKGILKSLAPTNKIIFDIASNPNAASAISKYLNTLDKNKKIYCVVGMLNNKIHDKFFYELGQANISKILTIDIPSNQNFIKKEKLKTIIEKIGLKAESKNSIEDAIKYISKVDPKSIILITGSIYLSSEVFKLN